jgi:acyl-CoA dehydrogenase
MIGFGTDSPVADLVTGAFESHQDETGAAALWELMETLGIGRLGLPEGSGGSGGELADAAEAVRLAAYFALPVPLSETLLVAGWLLARCGRDVATGPLALVQGPDLEIRPASADGWVIEGHASGVPWLRCARSLVVLAGDRIALADPRLARITELANTAGEPRDTVLFAAVPVAAADVWEVPAPELGEAVRLRAALGRAIAISGALQRVLALTVEHARVRSQFGRPIGRFQAVQQSIALLAAEVAAAGAAIERAVASPDEANVAMAKIRTGEAATVGCRIAHQVHGAVGFTREHRLQRLTRRAWAWRDEEGSEEEWAARLGRIVASNGADALWRDLAARG